MNNKEKKEKGSASKKTEIILGFAIISVFLLADPFSFFSLLFIYYFFIGVNFFPAIAIALPFLVLALE
jgi:hypothetical protein